MKFFINYLYSILNIFTLKNTNYDYFNYCRLSK